MNTIEKSTMCWMRGDFFVTCMRSTIAIWASHECLVDAWWCACSLPNFSTARSVSSLVYVSVQAIIIMMAIIVTATAESSLSLFVKTSGLVYFLFFFNTIVYFIAVKRRKQLSTQFFGGHTISKISTLPSFPVR